MLTERERQILEWIRQNPSISQQEIAQKAGISRSSVAVHISNLTRKGAILGRQYVLADRPYVVVIGGTNMDVSGKPSRALSQHDTLPGTVNVSAGGTARNVAHNLALLGSDVKLITAFGDDVRAKELSEQCRQLGIDVNHSITVPGAPTSTCLFIMDELGDMSLAIADMEMLGALTPAVLESRLDLISHAAACFVDANVSEESLRFIAENVEVPLFCDPVATTKAGKLRGLLGHFHTVKANLLEAQVLADMPIVDDASLSEAASRMLDTGLTRVIVTLGARGLYCADREGELRMPIIDAKVVSTTGAGDTMMAAVTWAYLQGETRLGTCAAGLAAAAISTESAQTVNPDLSAQRVRALMEGARKLEGGFAW
ncbi:MAG: PfkB family carbohydrate kinase [Tractidigestivibacter sp.]|jgi:pseudouridine kinase|uniref:PfkB family carbohydrate kinase n=1 Tax=Tractidigestivibacter sp. TaxID=2847320 RepID=UPI003D94ED22